MHKKDSDTKQGQGQGQEGSNCNPHQLGEGADSNRQQGRKGAPPLSPPAPPAWARLKGPGAAWAQTGHRSQGPPIVWEHQWLPWWTVNSALSTAVPRIVGRHAERSQPAEGHWVRKGQGGRGPASQGRRVAAPRASRRKRLQAAEARLKRACSGHRAPPLGHPWGGQWGQQCCVDDKCSGLHQCIRTLDPQLSSSSRLKSRGGGQLATEVPKPLLVPSDPQQDHGLPAPEHTLASHEQC